MTKLRRVKALEDRIGQQENNHFPYPLLPAVIALRAVRPKERPIHAEAAEIYDAVISGVRPSDEKGQAYFDFVVGGLKKWEKEGGGWAEPKALLTLPKR